VAKKKRTLLVFPNESLLSLVYKGEVKKHYFNPDELFERVVIIHPSSRDLHSDEKKLIQRTVGRASLEILRLNANTPGELVRRLPSLIRQAEEFAQDVRPDCIRIFGCHITGYLGLRAARAVNKPLVLSLHTNYDDMRRIYWRSRNVSSFMFWNLWRPFERAILKGATHVIASYAYARRYTSDNGVPDTKITTIYNKVDENRFFPAKKRAFKKPLRIICVMRQAWEKNQETLIRGMVGLEGIAHLTIVGDGPAAEENERLARSLAVPVTFVRRVINADLPPLYRSADVFATALRSGGIGIPVLESMATGLPIVHARYFDEPDPEILSSIAVLVDNNPREFNKAFRELANNPRRLHELGERSKREFLNLYGSKLEKKERKLYEVLISASA